MVMRTYYPPLDPESGETPEPERPRHPTNRVYDDQTPVRHGYTAANVSRIAYVALREAARRGAHDLDEKRAIAVYAVITELHEHDCDPGLSILMRAAERAVQNATNADWSDAGYNSRTKELQKGFHPYWRPGDGTPFDERVTERVAVPQILAALTERQRETVQALLDSEGSHQAAALLLGVRPNSVACNLRNVRQAFRALWFEHETPPDVNWRRGRSFTYSDEAAAARPEIARRAVRIREERRAASREAAAA